MLDAKDAKNMTTSHSSFSPMRMAMEIYNIERNIKMVTGQGAYQIIYIPPRFITYYESDFLESYLRKYGYKVEIVEYSLNLGEDNITSVSHTNYYEISWNNPDEHIFPKGNCFGSASAYINWLAEVESILKKFDDLTAKEEEC